MTTKNRKKLIDAALSLKAINAPIADLVEECRSMSSKITSDEIQALLTKSNITFEQRDVPHGRQFRFEDGAILNAWDKGTQSWQGKSTAIRKKVEELIGMPAASPATAATADSQPSGKPFRANNKVFIVYGHDTEAREQLELLLRRLKMEPIVLQNLPSKGATIIEKLEANSEVTYACVLLTPDDQGHPADQPKEIKYRARQNVVLELGMFLSRLGRKRVAILHKGNIELPSDINGLLYIPFKKRIDEIKERIGAELQEAEFQINIKDLLS